MTEIIMPKMGDAMEEGVLLEWLKKEGDPVKSGEPIATIQTDKATLEMEAEGSGVLGGLLVGPGETVPVGKPMALLLAVGEEPPGDWGARAKSDGASKAQAPSKPLVEEKPSKEEPAPVPKVEASRTDSASATPAAEPVPVTVEASGVSIASTFDAPASAPTDGGRAKASPLAKKIAAELGVELSGMSGSGPGGRIVEKDVRDAAPAERKAAKTAAPEWAPSGEDRLVALNKIRQITAQRTAEAKQTVPHFYVTVEVDVERVLAMKSQFEEEGAGKLSINDFVIKACAQALVEMPEVNATYKGESVLQFGEVNVGMAVALEDGLTLPVIHGAQRLSVRQIAERSRELAQKARDNRLSPEELSGGTFSISNMGMLNVDSFAAIISVPNAAIVAVATARKVVVPNEADELEIRRRMNLTGSFDHRVVDGAIGAKFMNLVRDYLESPTRLLG